MTGRYCTKGGKKKKHTPITSEAEQGFFGAELARLRAGKERKTGISEEDLASHLHESAGKKLPKRAKRGKK